MKVNCKALSAVCVVFFVGLLSGCKDGHAATTYEGREAGAEWRKAALGRIENIRKAELIVQVLNRQGKPLHEAQVKVSMQRHAFAFGSAVTARSLTVQTNDGQRYRQLVEKNFNKVVFENDLKWENWETSKEYTNANYRMDNTDSALNWLNQRGILVRGHYVVWGHLEGDIRTDKTKSLPPQAFRSAVMSHAEDKVKMIGQRVAEWDVVNHPLGWGRGMMTDLFGANFYDQMFSQVAKWNPQAVRYINEGGVLPRNGYNRDLYFRLISQMLNRGAKIDGIGFMGHFKGEENLAPPFEVLKTFDRYAQFGLPLQVTEFDVRFGKEMGKRIQLSPEQEALQADYMRDFLIAAFSHPQVVGVVMWGFWEGSHWYPDAALYRMDWSVKPNGRVWEDLVLKQWWTDVAGRSDQRGRFKTRGYLGDYKVEVNYRGKSKIVPAKLEKDGATLKISLDQ